MPGFKTALSAASAILMFACADESGARSLTRQFGSAENYSEVTTCLEAQLKKRGFHPRVRHFDYKPGSYPHFILDLPQGVRFRVVDHDITDEGTRGTATFRHAPIDTLLERAALKALRACQA